jgi:hypothetical protein
VLERATRVALPMVMREALYRRQILPGQWGGSGDAADVGDKRCSFNDDEGGSVEAASGAKGNGAALARQWVATREEEHGIVGRLFSYDELRAVLW